MKTEKYRILVTGGAGFTHAAFLTGQGTTSSTPSASAAGRDSDNINQFNKELS